MCESRRKLDVDVVRHTPFGVGKRWVRVRLKQSRTFYPSFRDVGRMVAAIAHCEEVAYPTGRGGYKVMDYLAAAVSQMVLNANIDEVGNRVDWDELDRRFTIPHRTRSAQRTLWDEEKKENDDDGESGSSV